MERIDEPAERTTRASGTWRRVKTIVGDALDRPVAERDHFVAQACAGDEGLRVEALSLLRAAVQAEKHFETPAGALTTGVATGFDIGGRVGPYRIVRELGTGGMGAVYLAERSDGDFEQRVAVKVVRGGFGTPFLLERFREERRILASLEHPNIARLIDGGTTEAGLPYVAMEYVEGESIEAFCRIHRLTVRQRLEIFRQVCAAVHYAHQRLVVHRDIKAGNILVTADGTPKLLDFGIAKLTQPGLAGDQSITLYRVVTPESASPEQLQGKPITIATDVYALGVLLFRMLTGLSPYGAHAASEAELIRTVCERPPDVPSAVARKGRTADDLPSEAIPSDLDVIVLKALRKEPERRYGSVEQMSEDVRRYLEGRTVLAAPDSVAYRTGKFVRRHRVAMLGVVGIAVALSAGIASTLWQTRVARAERARAERQFTAVRTLAKSVLGELYDAVSGLQGSLAAREVLLTRATEYLDTLARDAGDNIALRREVVDGYMRLGQIRGFPGMENLGDRAGAKRSYESAAAVAEPLAAEGSDPNDILTLADILTRLDTIAPPQSQGPQLQRARALIEGLPDTVRAEQRAASLEVGLWHQIGSRQVAAQDYANARISYTNEVRAAEAAWRIAPQDLSASRNLSLACKQLGAVLHRLQSRTEARTLFDKALALDRARVERDPAKGLWRLDVSFSLGSIGALLQGDGDLDGAFAHYQEAVDLRRAVVAAEPKDDFARLSLARGYHRLAGIDAERGKVAESLEWHDRRIQLYRAHLDTHPERDSAWRDYAQAAFGSLTASLDMLEAKPAGSRRPHLARVSAMLQTLVATRARWVKEGRTGDFGPTDEGLQLVAQRLKRLQP